MNHSVAIWANGTEVSNGVNSIVFTDIRYRHKMVDVNVVGSEFSIAVFKDQIANYAGETIVPYACLSSGTIAFVHVYSNLADTAFCVLPYGNLVGTLEVIWIRDGSLKRPNYFHWRAINDFKWLRTSRVLKRS